MNMKKLLSLALTAAVSATLFGCDDPLSNDISATNLMENVTPSKSPEKPSEEIMDSNSVAATDFAAKLLKQSFDGESNTLVSPLSVMSALAMTAGGAENNTLTQFEAMFGMSRDELNAYLKAYVDSLPIDEKYKLHLANSIWFTEDESFTVNESFLQNNADVFGADIYKAPFDNSTLKDINSWVNDNTDGMIPEIIEEIPADAVMYLVNALAFDAEWSTIYLEHQIREGEFTNIDGTKSTADYMHSSEGVYISDENASGFIKYYKKCKYAFAALLPNEGVSLSDYVGTLTGKGIASMLANPTNCRVNAKLPKFEYDYSVEMNQILCAMGLTDAFDPDKADFTGIGTLVDGNIYISRVLHKTYISVAEKGTKAGAATLVEMKAEGAAMESEPPKEVYLDRPFVYMIIDTENNVPVFIGTVTNFD